MGNNHVLNNVNIDGTNFYRSDITCENAVCIPGIVNISAGAEKNFSGNLNISLLLKKPLFKVLFSVFHSLGFAVKVTVLSAFSLTYFIIVGTAAILYLIFYEKLFKTLLISLEKKKHRSPYYYKWKKHHLELYYEV